jgi:hypothetical protein
MKRERVPEYVRRARKRFLNGLWHRAPIDAVLAGKRTLEQWTDVLSEERELERSSRTQKPGSYERDGKMLELRS